MAACMLLWACIAHTIGKSSTGARNPGNGFCELTRQNCGRLLYGYSQVIERKERETGIEPATSRVEKHSSFFIAFRGLKGPLASLGIWTSFANKELLRPLRTS
jgi:hypothetical protein